MKTKHNIQHEDTIPIDGTRAKTVQLLTQLKPWIILSGYWARYITNQTAVQDENDIELYIHPSNTHKIIELLEAQGFNKVWTRYDYVPNNENFKQYEKTDWTYDGKQTKSVIHIYQTLAIDTITINGWALVASTLFVA